MCKLIAAQHDGANHANSNGVELKRLRSKVLGIILAPVRTPDAVINKLNPAIKNASSTPLIAESIHSTGDDLALGTLPHFSDYLQLELKTWAKAVEVGNVKIN